MTKNSEIIGSVLITVKLLIAIVVAKARANWPIWKD